MTFFSNFCKFGNCNLQFASLANLIQHIEETHTDPDFPLPTGVEQLPQTVPNLSHILRVFQQHPAEKVKPVQEANPWPLASKAIKKRKLEGGYSNIHPLQFGASTAHSPSDFEAEDDSRSFSGESLSSLDSASRVSDTKQFISLAGASADGKYECQQCHKRLKNPASLRQHMKTLHGAGALPRTETDATQYHRCRCGKVLKTQKGIEQHLLKCTKQPRNITVGDSDSLPSTTPTPVPSVTTLTRGTVAILSADGTTVPLKGAQQSHAYTIVGGGSGGLSQQTMHQPHHAYAQQYSYGQHVGGSQLVSVSLPGGGSSLAARRIVAPQQRTTLRMTGIGSATMAQLAERRATATSIVFPFVNSAAVSSSSSSGSANL